MKKISIITVTYNCASTLIDTINSVNQQTARNDIEYIIIDGNSTDDTLSIIRRNENNIDKFISEPDKGIYDAMNKGLSLANGEWVGFLHADDLFFNNTTIETLITNIKYTNKNVVYGNLNYIKPTPPHHIIRHWQSKAFTPQILKRGWMPPHPTVYIKNNLIKKIGEYNINFKISADYDYMLRLFSNPSTDSLFLDTVMINMRLGGVSNNSLKNIIRKSSEDYQALKNNKIGGFYALFQKNFSKLKQFNLKK